MHQQHRVQVGDERDRAPEVVCGQVREVRVTRVGEEAFEAPYACGGQIAEVAEVVGDHAAPERDIDLAVALSRLLFHAQRVDSGGHRITVQRHVDERGDAARRGGRRRGGEAFPVGARAR